MDKQIEYYQSKLDYEMDSSDLFSALEKGENIMPLDHLLLIRSIFQGQ